MIAARGPIAVLDANVLYSASVRHLLLWLSITGAFSARWTNQIQDEWTTNLIKNRPDLDATRIARTRQLMDQHIDGALVSGHEHLIDSLVLPDANDRHVLAAAIHCGARFVVTRNLADYPKSVLAPHNAEAIPPDEFVVALFNADRDAVVAGARAHRAELRNPARSPEAYLFALQQDGMTGTARTLQSSIREI